MTEKITTICKIKPSFPDYPKQIFQYQMQNSKKISTLKKSQKLSHFCPTHPKSKLLCSALKPVNKGFIDENIFKDDDLIRLKSTLFKDSQLHLFDKIINGQIIGPNHHKQLYEISIKNSVQELFNGKSTNLIMFGCNQNNEIKCSLNGDNGLLHMIARNILNMIKLSKGREQQTIILQASSIALVDNYVYDLGQEKTVTNLKKTNKKDINIFKIQYEEQFRSLIYLSNNNLKQFEKKIDSKDQIHQIIKFYLKKGGQIYSEIVLLKLCNLNKIQKNQLKSIYTLTLNSQNKQEQKQFLDQVQNNQLMMNLINSRTILPNFINLLFYISSTPKQFESSLLTLKILSQFNNKLDRSIKLDKTVRQSSLKPCITEKILTERQRNTSKKYFLQKQNQNQDNESYNVPRPFNLKQRRSNEITAQKNQYQRQTYRENQEREMMYERQRELIKRNAELQAKVQMLQQKLNLFQEQNKGQFQKKKLQFIEKQIQYRRKIKKYKDMVSKFQMMVDQKHQTPKSNEKTINFDNVYKMQYEKLFQQNLLLKQENQMLIQKCKKLQISIIDPDQSQQLNSKVVQLQDKLSKVKKQKRMLDDKVKQMQNEINNLIVQKETDITYLRRS